MRGGFVVSAVWFCVFACVCQAKPVGAQGDSKAPPASERGSGTSESGSTLANEARPDADVQNSPEYRELIEQALSEFKHKNWPEARVLFRRANELSPNARTQRGIGVVSYEMRDYVQATLALAAALADTRQPLTDAQKRECTGLLTRARTFVGSYALSLEPQDADVSLDGAPLVRDGEGRVLVSFGEHTLSASAPGYQSSTSKFAVQGGERGELRLVLYKLGAPQAVGQATAPASSVEKTIEQPAPTEKPAPPRIERTGGLRYTWVALGASAAFGGAAAATWFVGQGKVDSLAKSCDRAEASGTPCPPGSVDTSQPKRFERATNALIGLSGGALITAVVLAAFEWPRERRLALDVGPRQLSLRGSF